MQPTGTNGEDKREVTCGFDLSVTLSHFCICILFQAVEGACVCVRVIMRMFFRLAIVSSGSTQCRCMNTSSNQINCIFSCMRQAQTGRQTDKNQRVLRNTLPYYGSTRRHSQFKRAARSRGRESHTTARGCRPIRRSSVLRARIEHRPEWAIAGVNCVCCRATAGYGAVSQARRVL